MTTLIDAPAPYAVAPGAGADVEGLRLHLMTLLAQLSELEMRAQQPHRKNARALVAEAQHDYDQAAREVNEHRYPEALASIARAYRVIHLEIMPHLARWAAATNNPDERERLNTLVGELAAVFGDEEAA